MRTAEHSGWNLNAGRRRSSSSAPCPRCSWSALAAWQLILAGQASWLAGNAARVGARAEAVGADPEAAARSALPAHLRRGLRVSRRDGR